MLAAALALSAAGMSVVPVKADGSKSPACNWKPYQDRQATPAELENWFGQEHQFGVGVVTGPVSGDLLMVEVEGRAASLIGKIAELALAAGLADLWRKMWLGWVEASPSDGLHWFCRLDHPTPGNQKLAQDADGAVLAETRGAGGYSVVAPSAGKVHPTGKPWWRVAGGPENVPTITAEERKDFCSLLATLGTPPPEEYNQPDHTPQRPARGPAGAGLSPGDDYEARTPWAEILTGWTAVYTDATNTRYWRRPGKSTSFSATTGHDPARDRLYVFTTSTPFEIERPYTKFGAYALLNHQGDHYAAARELRKQGFGTRTALTRAGTAPTQANEDTGAPESATVYISPQTGLLATTLLRDVEAMGPVAAGIDNKTWAFMDGVWVPGEREIYNRCVQLLGQRFRRAHVETILAMIMSRAPFITDRPATKYLNLTNGLLNWETGELEPHNPEYPITTRIPVAWNPGASCPVIDGFLRSVVDAKTVELLEELAGYCLYGDQPFHKAFMLDGTGRNGKGVYLRILVALIGRVNVAAVPPQKLDSDRFAVAQLFRKEANIIGDVDPRTFKETATFKQATGGDLLMGEHKYAAPFTFTSRSVIVAGFNSLPRSADTTEGFFSRWIVIPFPFRFEDRDADGILPDGCLEKDPGLGDRATAPGELEGFLLLAVAGLRRAMAAGKFSRPESVLLAEQEFRRHADPVRGFLADTVRADPNGWIYRASLHSIFRAWAMENGVAALSATRFNEKIREVHVELFGRRAGTVTRQGNVGWAGIREATSADRESE